MDKLPKEQKFMRLESLNELFEDQIKDIYSAEMQILRALPEITSAISNVKLKDAFSSHYDETRTHIQRLEKIAAMAGLRLDGKVCRAMEGLIKESSEAVKVEGSSLIRDEAIISAVQRIEHYEISAYGTARAIAEQLGLAEIADLLQESLDEESMADERLSLISEDEILPECEVRFGDYGSGDGVAGLGSIYRPDRSH